MAIFRQQFAKVSCEANFSTSASLSVGMTTIKYGLIASQHRHIML